VDLDTITNQHFGEFFSEGVMGVFILVVLFSLSFLHFFMMDKA